jgi:hypothetical protein
MYPMRPWLLALVIGAALSAPGVACDYGKTTSIDQASQQQTAQAQSTTQSGSN